MGVFQNFPHVIWGDDINASWVLEVCKRAEDTIKNLNIKIEETVRPMLQQQMVAVESYYNKLKLQFDKQTNDLISRQEKLQSKVNVQLNNNLMEMYKLESDVTASNKATITKTELEISKLRNETRNLIAKYDSIWESMSATQQAQIKKIISDFNEEYNKQLLDNFAEMTKLKALVENSINSVLADLDSTEFTLNKNMQNLQLYVDAELGYNRDQLNKIGKFWIDEVQKNNSILQEFYTNINGIIESFQRYNIAQFSLKADLSDVNARFEMFENEIKCCTANIKVINPTTSKEDTLQQTLWDINRRVNPWSITAKEYDDLHIKAKDYDWISKMFMNAQEYDEAGKFYLKIWVEMYYKIQDVLHDEMQNMLNDLSTRVNTIDLREQQHYNILDECCKNVNKMLQRELYMYSPISGKHLSLKNVILEMLQVIKTKAITAEDYDNLHLTANEYDSKKLTAYEYDWFAKDYI